VFTLLPGVLRNRSAPRPLSVRMNRAECGAVISIVRAAEELSIPFNEDICK
jgi:hypothetical protein